MMFRTKGGKLELRFDEDIADLVIANTEAAWRLKSVFTSMQELEERLVAQEPQAAHLEHSGPQTSSHRATDQPAEIT
jgi:hypothetical protein